MNDRIRSEGFAHGPATIRLGDLEVRRLGYGAMRLPGEGVWASPLTPERARALLRRAVELGVNLIDTAWYYGPYVANRLIFEALHPYPSDLVIATKLGGKRLPDKGWAPRRAPRRAAPRRRGRPAHAPPRAARRGPPALHGRRGGAADGVARRAAGDAGRGEDPPRRAELRRRGPGRGGARAHARRRRAEHAQRRGLGGHARAVHPLRGEVAGAVLDLCTARGIAYLPYFPLGAGGVEQLKPALAAIAARHRASPSQVALAWLLARSPVILPIPGTSSIAHLEENWEARRIALSPEEMAAIGG